ncbi:hypothetical protein SKA34_09723 [Photobacterium sp. SKA34]|nr:hypothetical protein SKA34_09723 [Photobacterium sp. SKA34]
MGGGHQGGGHHGGFQGGSYGDFEDIFGGAFW